ncbi:hypothetical protein SADUNF_Sadunf18G0046600 [Salix dunnii]|uniref:Uncharacterized protein n=1 Tax=Salix dunnii TaxID=1413687 RepID=A0A835MG63_9ROSI|nr:hypothetical protein SADUNF_Sadunf18G0046600 [Salix dunnii]
MYSPRKRGRRRIQWYKFKKLSHSLRVLKQEVSKFLGKGSTMPKGMKDEGEPMYLSFKNINASGYYDVLI